MAINRFDTYTPYRSQFIPKEFIADFEGLKQSVALQQQQYDQIQEFSSKLPKYMQGDQQRVEQLRLENEQRMEEVTNQYSQGIDVGNRARRAFLTDIKRDWDPSGRAYNIQSNYDSYNAYKKDLDDRLAKGPENGGITKEVYDAAIARSTNEFQSYDEEFKDFNQFNGKTVTNYVDIQAKLDDAASGFESEVREGRGVINGRPVGLAHNGQYFYTDTIKEEFVNSSDVRDFVMSSAMNDPSIRSFLAQEDDLFGGEFSYDYLDKDGKKQTIKMSRSQYTLNNIADDLSNKYGYMKQTDSRELSMNWVAKQNREWDREDKLKEEENALHRASLLIKQDVGIKPATTDGWKNTLTPGSPQSLEYNQLKSKQMLYPTMMSKEEKEKLKRYHAIDKADLTPKEIEEQAEAGAEKYLEYLQTEKGKNEYPNLYKMYKDIGPVVNDKGQLLSRSDRLEIATKRYNEALKDVNTKVMRGTSIEDTKDNKRRTDMNDQLFGTALHGGTIGEHTLYPYNNTSHEIDDPTNLQTFLTDNKITEEQWDKARKSFTVSKQLDPDSPGIPGGILASGFLPNDDGDQVLVSFIIKQPSVENENYHRQFDGLYKGVNNPFKDHGYGVGFGEPRVITNPNGDKSMYIIKSEPLYDQPKDSEGNLKVSINKSDPTGYLGMKKTVYQYDTKTGTPVKSDLTFDELSQYIGDNNPYKSY